MRALWTCWLLFCSDDGSKYGIQDHGVNKTHPRDRHKFKKPPKDYFYLKKNKPVPFSKKK